MINRKAQEIAKAVKELGTVRKDVYTLGELEAISRKANASLHEVMAYLRYAK